MAILSIPDLNKTIVDPTEIRTFFNARNIVFEQWSCDVVFDDSATQEEILAAYAKDLNPFMENGGYVTADVISINKLTENYDAIRNKFLAEHTHSEDEIRFFVDGRGLFWFHLENEPVFNLLCEKGDLISVPAGTLHWFDAGKSDPFVKAIRIFLDMEGWVPHYSHSEIEKAYLNFEMPQKKISYILTDIEGTTTSIAFVYDVLFPYFRENIEKLKQHLQNPEIKKAFDQTIALAKEQDNEILENQDQIIAKLYEWSKEDRKVTPLKTAQGILWEEGYKNGSIKGHVYDDVQPALEKWKNANIQLGVFSSGSIQAQKLIFGFSEQGDLTPYFSHYFDTTAGTKKQSTTYQKIATAINIPAGEILFLSDIPEELIAAQTAGYQTVQLTRPGTKSNWEKTASSLKEIDSYD